jgi:hypothetical protein
METVVLIIAVVWFGIGALAALVLAALSFRDRLRRKPPRAPSSASG